MQLSRLLLAAALGQGCLRDSTDRNTDAGGADTAFADAKRIQDSVSLELIQQLERRARAGRADPEGDNDLAPLVRQIEALHDPRAARAFVASLHEGLSIVQGPLVALGDAAVAPLVEALRNAPLDDRRDIVLTLGLIADSARALRVSESSMQSMRAALLETASVEGNLRLRAGAIQGLMAFDGDDIAALMRKIYATDRSPAGGNSDKVPYPAMHLAGQWLTRHGRMP